MKDKIIRISVALLLSFGFATSSQATLVTVNMTADNSFFGGLCFDSSCTGGTQWEILNSGPLANINNWTQSDSVTIDLGAGTHYFAWLISNDGEPTDGNPAALLAEILWDGNANYSSSAWEVCESGEGLDCSGSLTNATEYGFNGDPNIWTDVNGGNPVSGISTNANWIYTANNFADADPQAAIRTSITIGAVPEPSIIALFALGLFGLGFARRRKA